MQDRRKRVHVVKLYEIRSPLTDIPGCFKEIVHQLWPETEIEGDAVKIGDVRFKAIRRYVQFTHFFRGIQLRENRSGRKVRHYQVIVNGKGKIDLGRIWAAWIDLKVSSAQKALETTAMDEYLEQFTATLRAPRLAVELLSMEDKTFRVGFENVLSAERLLEFVEVLGPRFPELLFEDTSIEHLERLEG